MKDFSIKNGIDFQNSHFPGDVPSNLILHTDSLVAAAVTQAPHPLHSLCLRCYGAVCDLGYHFLGSSVCQVVSAQVSPPYGRLAGCHRVCQPRSHLAPSHLKACSQLIRGDCQLNQHSSSSIIILITSNVTYTDYI